MKVSSIFLRKLLLSVLFIFHFIKDKIYDYFVSIFIAMYIFSYIFEGLYCFYQIQFKIINHFFVISSNTLKIYCQHNFYELDDEVHKMWQELN